MPLLTRSSKLSSENLLYSPYSGSAWHSAINSEPYEEASLATRISDSTYTEKSKIRDVAGRVRCGSLECPGGRPRPWRSRRRPIFEDSWGCSRQCTLAMVRAAIRKESKESRASSEGSGHRHRVPLGLVLLGQGWITNAQLQNALGAQKRQGGLIGECLLRGGGIEQAQITRGLGMQWGRPVLSTAGFDPIQMALVLPNAFIEQFGIVPIRMAGSRVLYVGFETALDESFTRSLEQMTGLKVESGILSSEEVAFARAHLAGVDHVVAHFEMISGVDSLGSRIAAILEDAKPVYSKLVRAHQYFWLRLWLEDGVWSGAGTLPRDSEDVRDYIFNIN